MTHLKNRRCDQCGTACSENPNLAGSFPRWSGYPFHFCSGKCMADAQAIYKADACACLNLERAPKGAPYEFVCKDCKTPWHGSKV